MNEMTVLNNETPTIEDRMDSLTEGFIRSQDVGENSRETYQKALKVFLGWLSSQGIHNPGREDILAYRASLVAQGLSPLTVSSYMVGVRKFFDYLEQAIGYRNVAKGVKGGKRARGFRKDPLTIDQVRELLGKIDRSNLRGLRDYAILNLMLRTGLRTIEVIRADLGDIRQQSGEAVLWIQGKGRDSKDEFVLLTQESLKPINEYLSKRGKADDNAPLFVSVSDRNKDERLTTRSIRRIVKEHLRDIHLNSDRLTAHSLRHTFATVALTNGAPLIQVKEAMRHNSITTTMIYAHSLDRVRNGAEKYINL
jgi:integrase/recombinase XerD